MPKNMWNYRVNGVKVEEVHCFQYQGLFVCKNGSISGLMKQQGSGGKSLHVAAVCWRVWLSIEVNKWVLCNEIILPTITFASYGFGMVESMSIRGNSAQVGGEEGEREDYSMKRKNARTIRNWSFSVAATPIGEVVRNGRQGSMQNDGKKTVCHLERS